MAKSHLSFTRSLSVSLFRGLSSLLVFSFVVVPELPAQSNAALLLFGGENHKIFLGCLTCWKYSSDSIANPYGHYGSRYSSESIFNKFSEYGSRFSQYGVCNRYATHPPVIVDDDGNYYGRLTLNKFHPQIGIGKKLLDWLSGVCE